MTIDSKFYKELKKHIYPDNWDYVGMIYNSNSIINQSDMFLIRTVRKYIVVPIELKKAWEAEICKRENQKLMIVYIYGTKSYCKHLAKKIVEEKPETDDRLYLWQKGIIKNIKDWDRL
ncbi:hypothetical protein vBOeSunk162_36 [Oenococcus phage vB_OeS_unk162]|nr:hypothetical protein vBOeSunk162_36 [Oenococcus phage vB_OeS_unk162]